MNLFSTDGILFRGLNLIGDIVLLHLLWLVCSLPIITIGASTTALYYTAMKRVRKDEGYTAANFFSSFKENFKQSTILWLITAFIGFLFYIDFQIGSAAQGRIGTVMLIGTSLLLFPYIFTVLYLFPVQAKFENRILDTIKNAFLMSVANLGYTFLLLILGATFLLLGFFYIPFTGLFLVCGVGLYGYLSAGIYVFIFRKYLPDELKEDLESSGIENGFFQ